MNASAKALSAHAELLPQFSTARDFALDCDAADILAHFDTSPFAAQTSAAAAPE